jgi:hypothetical protein
MIPLETSLNRLFQGYSQGQIKTANVDPQNGQTGTIPRFSLQNRTSCATIRPQYYGSLNSTLPGNFYSPFTEGLPALVSYGGQWNSLTKQCVQQLYSITIPSVNSTTANWQWRNFTFLQTGEIPPSLYGHQSATIISNTSYMDRIWIVVYGGMLCNGSGSNPYFYAISMRTYIWKRLDVLGDSALFQASNVDTQAVQQDNVIFVLMASSAEVFM